MPVRPTPKPGNPFDSKAVLFECKLENQWRAIGYVVCEALDAVHHALNNREITEIKFDWVKYIMQWSRSGPEWYTGIKITKQGKWPKEAVQCSSTMFCKQ